MPRRQPYPHLKRDVTRHGQVRWYFRRRDEPKIRLPDYPGASKEAEAAYYAALENRPVTPAAGEGRFPQGSFGHLCGRYLSSPKFLSLAPITQSGYRRQIDALRRGDYGDIASEPYKAFRRKHIVAILERKATAPGEANNILKALQALFTYAVDAGLLEASPAAGVKKYEVTGDRAGGAKTWTEEHAAMFRARWPLGSPQRTAMEIMWCCGLRIGDAIKLGPQHVRDGRVRMVTAKRAVLVDNPIEPELAEALAAAPTRNLTFLATREGRTRSAKAAYSWFSEAAKAAGLPPGFSGHGCRKALATAGAESGVSEYELAAMMGWSSPRSAAPYVKDANKRRMADAGFSRLERGGEDGKGTTIGPPTKMVGQKRS